MIEADIRVLCGIPISFSAVRVCGIAPRLEAGITVTALPGALPEVIFALVAPLYELFDFFRLPKRLVEEELAEPQRNTF